MMSRMLGAPLGGTTRGGHHGLESVARSLITPPNFDGGGGSCFPSSVVVAPGEPGTPVTFCAAAGATAIMAASTYPATAATRERPATLDRSLKAVKALVCMFLSFAYSPDG
jgi:hypothetical protein